MVNVDGTISRRQFVASSAALSMVSLHRLGAMAGPFVTSDFDTLVPPDKKLNPEWVKSLTGRGERTVYTKKRNELRYIGMPVGGLCCGTVYLGGDGKLWLWDIFNRNQLGVVPGRVEFKGAVWFKSTSFGPGDGASYVAPHHQQSPFSQGFALRENGGPARKLDGTGWEAIEFTGEYPVGSVTYRDPGSAVSVRLTAFSPFIPLNVSDSSLPLVVNEFAITNESREAIDIEIGGWLENPCSLASGTPQDGTRINTDRTSKGAKSVEFGFAPKPSTKSTRPDVVLEDWNGSGYGKWRVEGTAFGSGPVARKNVIPYQGNLGGTGDHVVNTHSSAPGTEVGERDRATGKLTGPVFTIQRKWLNFHIGGGKNEAEVGMRLIVDGKVVRQASGQDNNLMRAEAFDVAEYEGKQAHLEIYDLATGPWGNVGVGQLIQSDMRITDKPLHKQADFGTMSLAVLGSLDTMAINEIASPEALFERPAGAPPETDRPIGHVAKRLHLKPGETKVATFLIAWHFPNSSLNVPGAQEGNHYVARFRDAGAVTDYTATNYARLRRDTFLWHETWNDSTLPHWFLDRTFTTLSTLATSTAHKFANGRFWAWEGVGCCEGTCTHVWHYAQAVGRIFPEIERDHRERVDFGAAFDKSTGIMGYRGEGTGTAVDGLCGRILGVLREHQMSTNDAFLRRVWPNVKRATQFLMAHDEDKDGLLDGAQENTLDAAWFGKIAWISSLYAAALRASETMAELTGDKAFAQECRHRFTQTKAALESELFNGEYFIQRPDPQRARTLGTYSACHIDQVHGQSWAWQVDLGRILDRGKTLSALRSLYKYNFAPDVGPFRKKFPEGRPYALAGDAGLIMATNPKELSEPYGDASAWQYGYFNECMSGFEHQAASHMIAEGMVTEGLAVTRAIHDRYHASRRNPYNEVECSDHYSRAMASYGSFITMCGYTYDGPAGKIGFDPRITPDDFRAPFTTAAGWGTYAQQSVAGRRTHTLALRWGKLTLREISLAVPNATEVTAEVNGTPLELTHRRVNGKLVLRLAEPLTLGPNQLLTITAQ